MAKYIFDFDDVLFYNTAQFKKHMYSCLEKAGVPHQVAFEYYQTVRHKFSLKNFLLHFDLENIYEEIMAKCPDFVNRELMEVVKKIGKDNCYIVTHGEEEYQKAKLEKSGIVPFFKKIYIIQDTKKEAIAQICSENKDQEVIFIDDKIARVEDVDLTKCPNLKTILYTGQKVLI